MVNEKILEVIDKYKNDPIAFVEYFYDVKLYPYQKEMLKLLNTKERLINLYGSYRHGRDIVRKGQVEYMKFMEMDFDLWTKEGIEVYEKGILVKTLKHKNKKRGD